jgi:hypothetical protein
VTETDYNYFLVPLEPDDDESQSPYASLEKQRAALLKRDLEISTLNPPSPLIDPDDDYSWVSWPGGRTDDDG